MIVTFLNSNHVEVSLYSHQQGMLPQMEHEACYTTGGTEIFSSVVARPIEGCSTVAKT